MRCFIGIDLPLPIKKQINHSLLSIQKNTKGWEIANDYHQTLLFIGEVNNSDIAEIKKRLASLTFRPFYLKTAELKFFKRRILYLDFDYSAPLYCLAEHLKKIFPEWVRDEEKDFLPHVTVKRWQRHEYSQLVEDLEKVQMKQYIFLVQNVSLFKSERDAENRKYHVIYNSPTTLSCHSAMDSLG